MKYERDPFLHVLCLPLATYQRTVMEARLERKDWQKIERPKIPVIPEGLPPHWRTAAFRYVPIFEVFEELRHRISLVAGDTGLSSLFAFPPYSCIDVCSYYGGSIPMALGFHLAGFENAWAVTGDYSFLAAGHMGLIETYTRNVPLKVLIMNNGAAMATGGQPIPPGTYEQILSGWAPYVSYIENVGDKEEIKKTLKRALESKRMEIISVNFRDKTP